MVVDSLHAHELALEVGVLHAAVHVRQAAYASLERGAVVGPELLEVFWLNLEGDAVLPLSHRKQKPDLVAAEEQLERGFGSGLRAMEVSVVSRTERWDRVVFSSSNPFRDAGGLAI